MGRAARKTLFPGYRLICCRRGISTRPVADTMRTANNRLCKCAALAISPCHPWSRPNTKARLQRFGNTVPFMLAISSPCMRYLDTPTCYLFGHFDSSTYDTLTLQCFRMEVAMSSTPLVPTIPYCYCRSGTGTKERNFKTALCSTKQNITRDS